MQAFSTGQPMVNLHDCYAPYVDCADYVDCCNSVLGDR